MDIPQNNFKFMWGVDHPPHPQGRGHGEGVLVMPPVYTGCSCVQATRMAVIDMAW